MAAHVLLSPLHPAPGSSADVDAIVSHAPLLLWAGAAATAVAALPGELDRRLREAADERGQLIAQTLTAEEGERRLLAETLHDDAIQNVLTVTDDAAASIGERIGIDWARSRFDLEEFRTGLAVELEHGRRDPATNVTDDDEDTAGKIAWAHLNEFPDYYTRLAKMEAEAERYRSQHDHA